MSNFTTADIRNMKATQLKLLCSELGLLTPFMTKKDMMKSLGNIVTTQDTSALELIDRILNPEKGESDEEIEVQTKIVEEEEEEDVAKVELKKKSIDLFDNWINEGEFRVFINKDCERKVTKSKILVFEFNGTLVFPLNGPVKFLDDDIPRILRQRAPNHFIVIFGHRKDEQRMIEMNALIGLKSVIFISCPGGKPSNEKSYHHNIRTTDLVFRLRNLCNFFLSRYSLSNAFTSMTLSERKRLYKKSLSRTVGTSRKGKPSKFAYVWSFSIELFSILNLEIMEDKVFFGTVYFHQDLLVKQKRLVTKQRWCENCGDYHYDEVLVNTSEEERINMREELEKEERENRGKKKHKKNSKNRKKKHKHKKKHVNETKIQKEKRKQAEFIKNLVKTEKKKYEQKFRDFQRFEKGLEAVFKTPVPDEIEGEEDEGEFDPFQDYIIEKNEKDCESCSSGSDSEDMMELKNMGELLEKKLEEKDEEMQAEDENETSVVKLVEMGIPRDHARGALEKNDWNLNRAADALFSGQYVHRSSKASSPSPDTKRTKQNNKKLEEEKNDTSLPPIPAPTSPVEQPPPFEVYNEDKKKKKKSTSEKTPLTDDEIYETFGLPPLPPAMIEDQNNNGSDETPLPLPTIGMVDPPALTEVENQVLPDRNDADIDISSLNEEEVMIQEQVSQKTSTYRLFAETVKKELEEDSDFQSLSKDDQAKEIWRRWNDTDAKTKKQYETKVIDMKFQDGFVQFSKVEEGKKKGEKKEDDIEKKLSSDTDTPKIETIEFKNHSIDSKNSLDPDYPDWGSNWDFGGSKKRSVKFGHLGRRRSSRRGHADVQESPSTQNKPVENDDMIEKNEQFSFINDSHFSAIFKDRKESQDNEPFLFSGDQDTKLKSMTSEDTSKDNTNNIEEKEDEIATDGEERVGGDTLMFDMNSSKMFEDVKIFDFEERGEKVEVQTESKSENEEKLEEKSVGEQKEKEKEKEELEMPELMEVSVRTGKDEELNIPELVEAESELAIPEFVEEETAKEKTGEKTGTVEIAEIEEKIVDEKKRDDLDFNLDGFFDFADLPTLEEEEKKQDDKEERTPKMFMFDFETEQKKAEDISDSPSKNDKKGQGAKEANKNVENKNEKTKRRVLIDSARSKISELLKIQEKLTSELETLKKLEGIEKDDKKPIPRYKERNVSERKQDDGVEMKEKPNVEERDTNTSKYEYDTIQNEMLIRFINLRETEATSIAQATNASRYLESLEKWHEPDLTLHLSTPKFKWSRKVHSVLCFQSHYIHCRMKLNNLDVDEAGLWTIRIEGSPIHAIAVNLPDDPSSPTSEEIKVMLDAIVEMMYFKESEIFRFQYNHNPKNKQKKQKQKKSEEKEEVECEGEDEESEESEEFEELENVKLKTIQKHFFLFLSMLEYMGLPHTTWMLIRMLDFRNSTGELFRYCLVQSDKFHLVKLRNYCVSLIRQFSTSQESKSKVQGHYIRRFMDLEMFDVPRPILILILKNLGLPYSSNLSSSSDDVDSDDQSWVAGIRTVLGRLDYERTKETETKRDKIEINKSMESKVESPEIYKNTMFEYRTGDLARFEKPYYFLRSRMNGTTNSNSNSTCSDTFEDWKIRYDYFDVEALVKTQKLENIPMPRHHLRTSENVSNSKAKANQFSPIDSFGIESLRKMYEVRYYPWIINNGTNRFSILKLVDSVQKFDHHFFFSTSPVLKAKYVKKMNCRSSFFNVSKYGIDVRLFLDLQTFLYSLSVEEVFQGSTEFSREELSRIICVLEFMSVHEMFNYLSIFVKSLLEWKRFRKYPSIQVLKSFWELDCFEVLLRSLRNEGDEKYLLTEGSNDKQVVIGKYGEVVNSRVVKRFVGLIDTYNVQNFMNRRFRFEEILKRVDQSKMIELLLFLLSRGDHFSREGGEIRKDVVSRSRIIDSMRRKRKLKKMKKQDEVIKKKEDSEKKRKKEEKKSKVGWKIHFLKRLKEKEEKIKKEEKKE